MKLMIVINSLRIWCRLITCEQEWTLARLEACDRSAVTTGFHKANGTQREAVRE
jgi:hypothetical protein